MQLRSFAATGTMLFALASALNAQAPPSGGFGGGGLGGRGGPGRGGRAAALFDPTGYWVAQITEDWKERIHPAAKGDVGSIPVSAAGRREATAWDPASANSCKAYGAGGILRMPGRLHITWEGNNLKIDFDSGSQTRMLSFGTPSGQPGDLQGVSIASWDRLAPALSGFTLGSRGGGGGGSLKIVTTKARPGYLARNGVPYGANATFTEYYDLQEVPGGDTLLVVTVEVTDPDYLSGPYWYSVHFKKQADASGWNPQPCDAK
jgi:hypothetical protein